MPRLIKEKASALGFCALGIASARPQAEMLERLSRRPRPPYLAWVPEERCSPASWLPGAQSVLVGAVSYSHRFSQESPGQGYISPFAWAPDYHKLVSGKLEELAAYICQLRPETEYVIQVDSGPGCERLYALAAGVGWQGKNNFIIVPGVGSFVWLGLLTTNLPLAADSPLASQCGHCRRCLEACPTQAYTDDYDFDHTRCLAYWLTEKGPLSLGQRESLGRHQLIYGCDYCQLACPHNSAPDPGKDWPEVSTMLDMTPREFAAYFKDTAALWRGSAVLRRNLVLVAAVRPDCRQILSRLAKGQGLAAEAARGLLSQLPPEDKP